MPLLEGVYEELAPTDRVVEDVWLGVELPLVGGDDVTGGVCVAELEAEELGDC